MNDSMRDWLRDPAANPFVARTDRHAHVSAVMSGPDEPPMWLSDDPELVRAVVTAVLERREETR